MWSQIFAAIASFLCLFTALLHVTVSHRTVSHHVAPSSIQTCEQANHINLQDPPPGQRIGPQKGRVIHLNRYTLLSTGSQFRVEKRTAGLFHSHFVDIASFSRRDNRHLHKHFNFFTHKVFTAFQLLPILTMAGQDIPRVTHAEYLQRRVRYFPSDPLHSAAYFRDLAHYMSQKPAESDATNYWSALQPDQPHRFLYSFSLSAGHIQKPTVYSEASEFLGAPVAKDSSELIFITGTPSLDWLEAIFSRLKVSYYFVQSHMNYFLNSDRDWYTSPGTPSRLQHSIRLLIPSIVFVGAEGRRLSARELHEARREIKSQVIRRRKSMSNGLHARQGHSIVRQVNIHSGDTVVLEQTVSISFIQRNKNMKGTPMIIYHDRKLTEELTVLIWCNAGEDEFVPIPNTPGFTATSGNTEFCPVFFEKELKERPTTDVISGMIPQSLSNRHPLSALPSRYGETLDWQAIQNDPVLVLEELSAFQSATASQYLNILRRFIAEILARTHPTGDTTPTMEDILHLEYTKAVLMRWSTHFQRLAQNLQYALPSVKPIAGVREKREKVFAEIDRDLVYLAGESETLITLCESGKSTITGSFLVYEAKRIAQESQLVTQLTKATNRITFIFLPISLVTSAFGMNFRQLGQGPLSISLWFAVSLPLLLLCIALHEYGSILCERCHTVWSDLAGM